MAHGLKCYCCGVNATGDRYYCHQCLKELQDIFNTDSYEILHKPDSTEHCNSCGEWENRKIINKLCSYICDKCVVEKLLQYEQEGF